MISSNNATDYLVRSTTWASGLTADSTAMTDIGANDYCAETLLADSTWCNAICNSTYFESVLTTKVPTMTSNTTPSGEVIYSQDFGDANYSIWKSFDGNISTTGNVVNANNCYFGYHFTSDVKVKKVVVKGVEVSSSAGATWQVKGSSDGITWSSPFDEKNVTNGTDATFIFFNDTAYSRYIIFQPTKSGTNLGVGAKEVQFYGR